MKIILLILIPFLGISQKLIKVKYNYEGVQYIDLLYHDTLYVNGTISNVIIKGFDIMSNGEEINEINGTIKANGFIQFGNKQEPEYYNEIGQKLTKPIEGINIIRIGNITLKKYYNEKDINTHFIIN